MYYLIQYGAVFAVSSYLVLTYASPTVSYHIKFWSTVTWILNFSLAFLVPEDVYLTILNPAQSEPQFYEAQVIAFQYVFLYWSVYALTWTIIPVLQQWENSGDIKSQDRLKRSLKVNGIFYLYMLITGILFLLILWYFNVGSQMGLIIWLKCLATVWGIFLLIVMMGYAIVEIPRSMWLQANHHRYMKYCYQKLEDIEDSRNQAIFQFKQISSCLTLIKSHDFDDLPGQIQGQISRYYDASFQGIPSFLKTAIPSNPKSFLELTNCFTEMLAQRTDSQKKPTINNIQESFISKSRQQDYRKLIQSLIEYHRLMKRVLTRYKRLTLQLDEFYRKAILYEDIMRSKRQGLNRIESPVISGSNKIQYYWIVHVKPVVLKMVATILTIFSIIILISETQVFLSSSESTSSLLGWIIKIKDIETIRVLVFITISIISYMVYYSLFRLKFSNLYGLYKNNSDGPSLMFATINFSRVGLAIVLNFFDMIKLKGIYTDVLGTVKMGLIGDWVIKGLPGVLWLIVLCHYLKLWPNLIEYLKLPKQLKFQTHQVSEQSQRNNQEVSNETKSVPGSHWIQDEVKRYRKELTRNSTFTIYSKIHQ